MAVLVTGGAGYIGSHMVLSLLEQGEDVTILDNLSTGLWWLVPPRALLVKGDIGDQAVLDDILGAKSYDAIIHFAGSIVVPESVADPLSYYLNNTVKSREVLAAAVRHRVPRFIFSSTAAVYGMPETGMVDEKAPLQPISPYGASKLMSEQMLADVGRAHGLSYAILRYFNVAGADDEGRSGQSNPQATHLIKIASQTALGQRPFMEIFGRDYDTPDGTCVRDYIHVSDLIDAHSAALSYLREGGASDIFNCGYGQGYSVAQVIHAVEAVSGKKITCREGERRAGDPAQLIAKADKARQILSWQPKRDDLQKIVKSALDWEAQLMRRTNGA